MGGQFRLDRQAKAAGQTAAKAGRQHHTHAHITQAGRGGAHQHEGFGWRELHGFRGGGIEAPLDRIKHLQGPAQALQQQGSGVFQGHFPQGELVVPRRPDAGGRKFQAGVGLGLEAEAQLPQLLPLRRREQFQAGMGRLHPAGHRLAPVVGGGFQPFGVLAIELQPAIARAEGLLPGAQEGIEAGAGGAEACPQLAIEQGLQQPGHQEPLGAGPAAAEAVAAFAGIHHLGQARRQVFEAAAVVFAVEQGLPAAAALAGLRQPAAPGQQAQAPAFKMAPPAQFIGQLAGGSGQGQLVEPLGGGGGLEQPALHPPGPPLHLFGQGFAGLERQAAPDRALGFGAFAAAAGLAAAGQGEGGLGGPGVLRPQVQLL